MAWTTPRNWVGGELVDQTMMNTHVRDNENYLYAVAPFLLDLGSIANNGTAALSVNGDLASRSIIIIFISGAGGWSVGAIYNLRGAEHSTGEIADAAASFSASAGTGSQVNIYWSGGNSRYEIENKSSVTLAVKMLAWPLLAD